MSETHTVITGLYESTVKEMFEPVDAKKSFVEKSDDMTSVFSLLCEKNHVWVVDDQKAKQVLGIITESDTIQLFAPPYTPLQSYDKPTLQSFQFGITVTAEDIMSKQPITVQVTEKIIKVIATMKEQNIKQLAVVDEQERLIGEITLNRLIKEYSKRSLESHK
jgi:predicted transcriptional regulator